MMVGGNMRDEMVLSHFLAHFCDFSDKPSDRDPVFR